MRHAIPAFLLCSALLSCATNPATGRRELMLVSESQEIAMGREYDKQVVATIGLYPDSGLQRYVQQLGARLAAGSERPNLPWTFRVVDDPVVNAFALPGGFIYVTRGIFAHLNSEAELTAVVGHEIGHVTARHTASQMSKQQIAQLGLAVGSLASKDFERYAGVAGEALGVLFLKYSRDAESEADHLGLRYMRRANYDPREMPHVFEMLTRVSAAEGGGRVPEWLATHPNPENRRGRIEAEIAALPSPQSLSGTLVNRDSYLQRLDGLVFGADPRQGYFKGTDFYHPGLRFRFSFPAGWTTNNGQTAVTAVSPQQDAAVELSLAGETSAAAAVRAFSSQSGLTAGDPAPASVGGLPAATAPFAATTQSGTLRGTVVCVEHGNAVYRLVAYGVEARWPGYRAAAEAALQSFRPLTDPAALSAQPQRVQLIRLDRATTIADLARQRTSPLPAEKLALINQVDPTTPLAAGRLVKWVTGAALP